MLGDVAVLGTLLLRVAGGVGLEPTLPRGLGATGGGLGRVGGGGFTRPPPTPPPTSSIFDVAVVFSFFSSLISAKENLYHADPITRRDTCLNVKPVSIPMQQSRHTPFLSVR